MMDETQLLPCTQVLLGDGDENEKESFENGWLEIEGMKHDLVLGENKIGRNPDTCQVLLHNAASVSKEHAVLEVEDGCATLMDLASRNKTRMGKLVLRPHIRYALCGGEKLLFGNVSAMYMTSEDSHVSGEMSEDHQGKRDCDVKLSGQPTSSLASTPTMSLSQDLAENSRGHKALSQENGCAKNNQSGSNIIESHSPDLNKPKYSSPKKMASSPNSSDAHSTTSKANTSFEMLTTDNFPPNTPVLELTRSNSCSPFRKGTQDRKYVRKCFFMPTQAKNVVEESDEEAHSDASRGDDDFDDSIISPTPQIRCSSSLTGSTAPSQSTASSLLSTPVPSSKLQNKLATIPETPCSPLGRCRPELGSPSIVPDSQSSPGPSHLSAAALKTPPGSSSRSDTEKAEGYNSDASTDIESELDKAEEEDATITSNNESSPKLVAERRLSTEAVSKANNAANEDSANGDENEELTQVFSGKTCLASQDGDLSLAEDAPIATQDVLEAFGENIADSSEISFDISDKTQDILSAFDESTLSPGKNRGDTFKKPFPTPGTGKKAVNNSRKRCVDDSALTQDVLDLFDCPTQVVTGNLPRPILGTANEQDDISFAPTQLYVGDAKDITEQPTQVMLPGDDHADNNDSISDMCTQIYNEDAVQNVSQKPGMMTPVSRRRVAGKTTPDDFKSPATKALNQTEMESPSCLPTQIYNENLNSPRHGLHESISDMATQPYHPDLDVSENNSPRPLAGLDAELSMNEMATQLYIADKADETKSGTQFSKPWSVEVEKENDDSLSEMATQPYAADSIDDASKSVAEFAFGVSTKTLSSDSLSDMATQPYFECTADNTPDMSKNKDEVANKEVPVETKESISNMVTLPYAEGNADDNEPTDDNATQLFDSSESEGSSKTVVEAQGDNLAVNESHDAYDEPTQDMLNGETEGSPFPSGEDYDAPTQIIPCADQPDHESNNVVTGLREIPGPDDEALTPLKGALSSEGVGRVSNNAGLCEDGKKMKTRQTPVKSPETNNDITLTPSLNPYVQKPDVGKNIEDSQSVNFDKFNEDQDTDSCNSSTVSDTMLVNMPEEIGEEERPNFNSDDILIDKSSSGEPDVRTSAFSFITPALEDETSMPDQAVTSDSNTPTPDVKASSHGAPVAEPNDDITDSELPPLEKSSPATRTSSPATRTSSPATRTSSPAARTSSPAARTSSPAARTSSPAARTSSPAARTPNKDVDAIRESKASSSIENSAATNSFQFGSNQYDVSHLDSDGNASDDSIETLKFLSDTESGSQSCQALTPVRDGARKVVSTPKSSDKTTDIDVKTLSKISEDESVFPRRSKRSPRQSTLRKKKNRCDKSKDVPLISSDDDSELDASSQALFSMSLNKMTALKSSDDCSNAASSLDLASPLGPAFARPVLDAEEEVKGQPLSTASNIDGITTEPQSSAIPGDGIEFTSIQNHCESSSAPITLSSDSDDEPLKGKKNVKKLGKTARASRVLKRKCPETNIDPPRVRNLKNTTQVVDETSQAAGEGTSIGSCTSAKEISARRRLEHTSISPSRSSIVHPRTTKTRNSAGKVSTNDCSTAPAQKQANDHLRSVRVRSAAKSKEVTETSVRSTRSARARRPPTRYSPDKISRKNNDNDDQDMSGIDQENSCPKTYSTATAQKHCRYLKSTAKRLKISNEVDSSVCKEAGTSESLSNKINHAEEESVETVVIAARPCSSSDVSSNFLPESVSNTSKVGAVCKSHPTVKVCTYSEAEVNEEVDSESTVSSTTDTVPNNRGRSTRPKNRVSIETSTPSKSIRPSRNSKSRASFAVSSNQVKTCLRQGSGASSHSGTSSAVDGFNEISEQSTSSRQNLPVLHEEENEITFNTSGLHRKSTRFSTRNASRNNAVKRSSVVANNAPALEVEEPSTRTKRLKIEQPSPSVSSESVNHSSVADSSTLSSARGGPRKSNRKTLGSRLTVHSQETQPPSTVVSAQKSEEENHTANQAQNSQSTSFVVPISRTAKRNLRISQDSRTVPLSQESSSSSACAIEEVEENDSVQSDDESQSSSKPKKSRGRPRKSRIQNPPAPDREDLNCSVGSVESFASSVGRRHQSGSSSQRSSTVSDRGRLLSESYLDNSLLLSPSERQSRANTKPRVLFTGIVPQADDLRTLKKLGGVVVESATQCSVLVSTSAKRTCKLLACVARGVPVVTPGWLSASAAAAAFTDPWEYIVKDTEMETKHGFELRKSLLKARGRRLLAGVSVHATPSVLPQPDDMRDLVMCCGGEYLERPPRSFYDDMVVVSCEQDKKLWPAFRKVNIPVVSTEFILSGILRAEVSIDSNRLQ